MKQIVQSNGKSENSQIEKTFEPLTQDTWVEKEEETGRREIAFSDQMRSELGIEEEDDVSKSN